MENVNDAAGDQLPAVRAGGELPAGAARDLRRVRRYRAARPGGALDLWHALLIPTNLSSGTGEHFFELSIAVLKI